MIIDIATETNRIVKIKTEERELTILLNEEEFRILEYAPYQLEIP